MMSVSQLLSCISKQKDGQYIARYNNFTLKSVFQPIYMQDLSIAGLEALIRISSHKEGNITPDYFFQSNNYSEQCQINVERLSRLIHIQNFGQSPFNSHKLFLNVLPKAAELLAKENANSELLSQTILQSGLTHKQIVMELLELDASDEKFLYKATTKLSRDGFQIAIDDYGINASTRERVKSVKPDIIKIDRSLLVQYERGNSSGLMEALSLAEQMHSQTVIEGIETKHQLNLMRKIGFDMYQGYYLAMPNSLINNEVLTQAI